MVRGHGTRKGRPISGTPSSSGARLRASRPHKIATSGSPRAARALIACSVTASQPLPRCDPGFPGWTVSTLLSSSTPRWSTASGPPSPGSDIRDRRRTRGIRWPGRAGRPDRGRHREAEPDRMARRGVRVLAHDQHPHLVERLLECPQHLVACWQVSRWQAYRLVGGFRYAGGFSAFNLTPLPRSSTPALC